MTCPLPLIALLAGVLVQAAQVPAPATIRERLAAWERNADHGRPDPAALVGIAASVLEESQGSRQASVAVEACGSSIEAPPPTCEGKLWKIARDTRTRFNVRAGAASVLVEQEVEGAAAHLLKLVSAATPAELAPVASLLRLLPARQSIPHLRRLLESSSPTAHAAGCRALAEIDTGESRTAIAEYLASAPRGTAPYYACTLAAARLGDPVAARTTSGIVNYLADGDLVEAAVILGRDDPERAANLLMLVTRQGSPLARLLAANELVPLRPDVASRIMTRELGSDRADRRAAALEVHRTLSIDADRRVRALLLDEDPLVRLRAAETILNRAVQLGQHEPRRRKVGG